MMLADYVRILGRGPGRARSLTAREAESAMSIMLSDRANREAIGAILMLLRMKGETAEEIAGFAKAASENLPKIEDVALDWPSYAAGRTRGLPLFLLSARLVALAGYPVLLHGWNGEDAQVRAGLGAVDIPVAKDAREAQKLIISHKIAYLKLEDCHPNLFKLLQLRKVLGLRSCINTVCRMLNPAQTTASVQGVFHPSYRLLQSDAAELLGWKNLSVIKGGGGEFECNPAKPIAAFGLRDGHAWQTNTQPSCHQTRRLSETQGRSLNAIWNGSATPEFETHVILNTATLALETLGVAHAATVARSLWDTRHQQAAA